MANWVITMRPLLLILLLLVAGCDSSVETPQTVGTTKLAGSSMGNHGYSDVAVIHVPYKKLEIGMWVRVAVWDAKGKIVKYVGHRIVGRDGPMFITQGDSVPYPDILRLTPSNYGGVIAHPVTFQPL